MTLSHDSATQTTVTDALGIAHVSTFSKNLDRQNLLSRVNQQDGKTMSWTYDANNNVVSFTNEEGQTKTYGYDATNQQISNTVAAGTANARTTSYEYISPFISLPTTITMPSVHSGSSKTISIGYDGYRPATISSSGYTPDGGTVSRTVSIRYNAAGEVTEINGPRTDVNDVTTFAYYDCTTGSACGQLQSVTNALGQTSTFDTYDANGRLLSMTTSNGLRQEFAYDALGRVIQVTQTPSTGSSRVTRYRYDAVGQVVQSIMADGRTLNYTYDAAHYLRSITDNAGNTVTYNYDAKGDRTQVILSNPDSSIARSFEFAFDLRGQVTSINAGGSVTQLIYDAVGNLVSETDPNNNPATAHHYDPLNRLIQTIDRLGNPMSVAYDINDKPTQVQAPNGATTTYVYDDLGNLLQENSPDRGTLTYTYDSAGNVLTQTDVRGVKATFTYDALNRPMTITYKDPTGGSIITGWFHDLIERWQRLWNHEAQDPSKTIFSDNVTYTYDTCGNGIGRLCGVQDQSGVTTESYDAFGNKTQETRNTLGRTYLTQYTYDAANRIQTITYPSGRQVTYTRDQVGRITAVNTNINGQDLPIVSNVTYRADGLPTNETFGNGIQDTRSYDTQGRLLTQYLGIDTRVYGYDPNGNVTSLQTMPKVYSYGYDALDRLVQDTIGNLTTGFTYDQNGNRLTKVTDTQAVPYAYTPNSNRLIQVNGQTITLDPAGNTIADENGNRTFTYSPANRLFQVYTHNHLAAVYLYNANNQRTTKVTDRGITLYDYDQNGNLISETTDKGKTIKDYVYVNSTPIAQIDNNGMQADEGNDEATNANGHHDRVLYLHTDHLGTPRLATNQNQTLVWRWQGGAFGESQPETGEQLRADDKRRLRATRESQQDRDDHDDQSGAAINLRFPGQYYDEESGLFYNWHRYYDPRTARYISSDPIGLAGGANPFAYATSNPARRLDPFGLADSWYDPTVNPQPGYNSVFPPTTNCSFVNQCIEKLNEMDPTEIVKDLPEGELAKILESGKKAALVDLTKEVIKGDICSTMNYDQCNGDTSKPPWPADPEPTDPNTPSTGTKGPDCP